MPRCLLSLGGNLGDVEGTFSSALSRIDEPANVSVTSVSRTHRTTAVGDQAGDDFRNAAAMIETDLLPLELLDLLQLIENESGRVRDRHWGPRTLDLDLVLYGDAIVEHPRLQVPHPACWYRRFVLDPVVEIASDVVHPERGVTFGELRERLLERPLRVGIVGGTDETRGHVIESLRAEFPSVRLDETESMSTDTAIVAWLGDESGIAFDSLPRTTRLDAVTGIEAPTSRLRYVIQSALGG